MALLDCDVNPTLATWKSRVNAFKARPRSTEMIDALLNVDSQRAAPFFCDRRLVVD